MTSFPTSLIARATLTLAPLLALASGCSGEAPATTENGGAAGAGGVAGSGGSAGDAGTGGTAGSGGVAGAGGTAGAGPFMTAPHPPFPTLSGSMSAVIPHGKLVTITFGGNADADKIEAAGDVLVASKWLLDVGKDYGVGAGEHLAKVRLPEAAPAMLTESQLFDLIDQHIADGMIPAPTPDTMYMIYISAETTFSDPFGYAMCTDYLGYHYQQNIKAGELTYGIVGDCGGGFSEVTATFAHEYIEIASDPGPVGGYFLKLGINDPWFPLNELENADLCDYSDYVVEGGFSFQKVWSNSAAKAAVSSPCAPVDPNEVYYNISAEPAMIPKVAGGQSATFTLTGWSTAEIPDWDLHYDTEFYGDFTPMVDFSATTINNGKTVTVTLTVPKGTQAGLTGTAMIYSGQDYSRYWPVSVRAQ